MLTAINTDGAYGINLANPLVTIVPYSSGTRPYKIKTGTAISYTIGTTGGETSSTLAFSASNLPGWLTLDPASGALTGTAPAISSKSFNSNNGVSVNNVTDIPESAAMINVSNAYGPATNSPMPWTFQVTNALAPNVTSAGTATGSGGGAFTEYDITADNSPTSFIAYDLGVLGGLVVVDPATGHVTGTIPQTIPSGTYTFYVAAANANGEGLDKAVVVTVVNTLAPVVSSAATGGGAHGGAFTEYDITASHTPTSFAATGLAQFNAGAVAGTVACNAATGKITGNCGSGAGSLAGGVYNIGVTATNAYGTSPSKTVAITLT
jgi:hypothetical protein